jgi:hypothetical protein
MPCSALFRTESPDIIGESDQWLCDSTVRRVAQIALTVTRLKGGRAPEVIDHYLKAAPALRVH